MQILGAWFNPNQTVRVTPEKGLYDLDEHEEFISRCVKASAQIGVASTVRAKMYGITEIVTGDWLFATKALMPKPQLRENLTWGVWLSGQCVELQLEQLGRSPVAFVTMIRRMIRAQGWVGEACLTDFGGVAFYVGRFPGNHLVESRRQMIGTAASRGGRAIHPWEAWVDGYEHTIRRGIDFDCEIESMRTILSNGCSTSFARELGLNSVTTHRLKNGDLVFRFYDKSAGTKWERRRPATIPDDGQAPSTQEV